MLKKADLIIGSGERSADLRYATGLATPDDFLYFAVDEIRGAVLSPLEHDRALHSVKPGVTVFATADFPGHSFPELVAALAERYRIGRFEVPADFPLGLAEALRGSGLTLQVRSGIFFPEREFKDDAETAEVRRGVQAAATGARRAFEVLAEATIEADSRLFWRGEALTSERLRCEIDQAQLAAGAMPGGTIAAGGRQGAEPHHTGSGPLYAHTPIVMDIFPRLIDSGYWGDLTRTVVKGRAPEIVRRAFTAVREAREQAKAQLRPGAIPAEIHQNAVRLLDRHGFRTGCENGRNFGFFHGLGHGLGLEIHEAPRLSPGNTRPLRGGEIVTVEPGLYYPEWGGIRLEDVVRITPDGCECLTELPDPLEIP